MSEDKARVILKLTSGRFDSFNDIVEDQIWWNQFIAYSSTELVSPCVGYELSLMPEFLQQLPVDVVEYFVATHTLNKARNEKIRTQLIELVGSLNKVGIVPALLKGSSSLVQKTYPSVGYRVQGDIDILVTDSEFIATIRKLKREGYDVASKLKEKYFLSRDYFQLPAYPELVRDGASATIDVHRVPAVYLKAGKQFNKDLRARLKPFDLDGTDVALLSPVDEFIHSLYHSQVQNMDYASGSVRLRGLIDLKNLYRIARTSFDESAIHARLNEYGLLDKWLGVSSLIDYLHGEKTVNPALRFRLGLRYPAAAQFASLLVRRSRVAVHSPERYVNPLFWKKLVGAYKY